MKKIVFFSLVSVLFNSNIFCQDLYVKTFGNPENQAVIFLHGGPGYNCANFEFSTAEKLAEKNFFVIAYDRSGEGRSINLNAKYTFKESSKDILSIYEKYKLKKAILIGHSFGGTLATLFAEENNNKVSAIYLVAASISFQETFTNIIDRSKKIYITKNDTANLNKIALLETMDTTGIEFSSFCFSHAMNIGAYNTKTPTDEAKTIYKSLFQNQDFIKYAFQLTSQAPYAFWKNENYTISNITENIKYLLQKNIPIFGLYGNDDGLFSKKQLADLSDLIGSKNVKIFENASHSIFIDQQNQFIQSIKNCGKEN